MSDDATDDAKLVSPAQPRSFIPHAAAMKVGMFGACKGTMVDMPGDNSCFFHGVRFHVLDDPALSCLRKFIGFGVK